MKKIRGITVPDVCQPLTLTSSSAGGGGFASVARFGSRFTQCVSWCQSGKGWCVLYLVVSRCVER